MDKLSFFKTDKDLNALFPLQLQAFENHKLWLCTAQPELNNYTDHLQIIKPYNWMGLESNT